MNNIDLRPSYWASVSVGNGKYNMTYRDRKCREKYIPRIKAILEEMKGGILE